MASTIQVGLIFLIGSCAYLTGSYGATFTIQNNCPYTVWPAFLNPNGGFQLSSKQKMVLTVAAGTKAGRIWARTGCSFNGGRGSCATGDCGGLLSCQASGAIPTTLVEYTLNGDNNQDFYDISLVDGFNVPVSVTPSPASGGKCITTACLKDVNADCPSQLKTNGGCKSACAAFPTNDQYCCRGQFVTTCPSSTYSQFFKNECPQAYSYAKDDSSSTFVCPGGRDYTIAFCQ